MFNIEFINMAQAQPILKLLRNTNLYSNHDEAFEALTNYLNSLDGEEYDGTICVATYSEDDTFENSISILGVKRNGGCTIFDQEGTSSDVEEAIRRAINALDVDSDEAEDGKYVASIEETNGIIAVKERKNVSEAILNEYAKGDDETAITNEDTINSAFSKIEVRIDNNEDITAGALTDLDSRINSMNKTATAENGKVVTTITEVDGKVSEIKENVKDLQLGGYSKASTTGAINADDTINTALSKLENRQTVSVKTGDTVIKTTTSGGNMQLETDIKIAEETASLPTNVLKRYKLLGTTNTQLGQYIDIYKDKTLKSVELIDQELVFTYILSDGEESVVRIDVSKFLTEAEFKDGLQVNTDGEVSVKIDAASEDYLSVSENGIKLEGIETIERVTSTALNDLETRKAEKEELENLSNTILEQVNAGDAISVTAKSNKSQTISVELDDVSNPLVKTFIVNGERFTFDSYNQTEDTYKWRSLDETFYVWTITRDLKDGDNVWSNAACEEEEFANISMITSFEDATDFTASDNILQITNDGLYLGSIYDCGEY